jgi:hypothetical protein
MAAMRCGGWPLRSEIKKSLNTETYREQGRGRADFVLYLIVWRNEITAFWISIPPSTIEVTIAMNIINLRRHVRRTADTRPNSDRRSSPLQSTATEMQGTESAFAKINRREAERRLKDRRKPLANRKQEHEALPPNAKYARFKLTRGERNLIQDMFLSDLDKE